MEHAIRDILDALRDGETLDAQGLDRILRTRSAQLGDGRTRIAKKRVLPFYLDAKENDRALWESWGVDEELERRFIACVRMKPRRSASGVATITVITKPWPCRGSCIYCPNDVRMPKSYLHSEPACQRAERCWFDPYLQVAARLSTLEQMGHATGKIELIVLGGTWFDYPPEYRIWFTKRLFDALNSDSSARRKETERMRALYRSAGVPNDPSDMLEGTRAVQASVNSGEISYNDAVRELYIDNPASAERACLQTARIEDVRAAHLVNEKSSHRVVGLVYETRPDTIDASSLRELRLLGCTKVQIGIQSTDGNVLTCSDRGCDPSNAVNAIGLVRLFGFKIHAHIMANLPGCTPETDRQEFARIVESADLRPDELKLYPCALVDGTPLMQLWKSDAWQPYTEDELISLLADDVASAPPYLRISRMIRDIGADDIVAGNKKANLRQMVEERVKKLGVPVQEIRMREIAKDPACLDDLRLAERIYDTSVSQERFLQWVDSENRIYGFLRLSLPHQDALESLGREMPVAINEAMIREVHVYGFAEQIHAPGASAQHRGLGRNLIERACEIARTEGFSRINVISAVGTREYYRNLGFEDGELYQSKSLVQSATVQPESPPTSR